VFGFMLMAAAIRPIFQICVFGIYLISAFGEDRHLNGMKSLVETLKLWVFGEGK
jgi:hypothetical protein